jgi:hypothetical protein
LVQLELKVRLVETDLQGSMVLLVLKEKMEFLVPPGLLEKMVFAVFQVAKLGHKDQ